MHSKEHVIEEFPTCILERGASSRPKKARASLPFRLASRAYGSVGTVEQGSYSDTGGVSEVEKGQTINQKVRKKNRKNHSQKNKGTVHSVLCNKQKTEISSETSLSGLKTLGLD